MEKNIQTTDQQSDRPKEEPAALTEHSKAWPATVWISMAAAFVSMMSFGVSVTSAYFSWFRLVESVTATTVLATHSGSAESQEIVSLRVAFTNSGNRDVAVTSIRAAVWRDDEDGRCCWLGDIWAPVESEPAHIAEIIKSGGLSVVDLRATLPRASPADAEEQSLVLLNPPQNTYQVNMYPRAGRAVGLVIETLTPSGHKFIARVPAAYLGYYITDQAKARRPDSVNFGAIRVERESFDLLQTKTVRPHYRPIRDKHLAAHDDVGNPELGSPGELIIPPPNVQIER